MKINPKFQQFLKDQRRWLQLIAAVAVLLLFLKWIDISSSLRQLRGVQWGWVLLFALLGVMQKTIRGLRFYQISRALGVPVSPGKGILVNYAALVLAVVSPGRLGEGGKVLFFDQGKRELAAGFVFERLADLAVYVVAGASGVFLFSQYVSAFILGAVLIVSGVVIVFNLEKILSIALRRNVFQDEWLKSAARHISVAQWIWFALLTVANWLLMTIGQYAAARAMHLNIPVLLLIQAFALSAIAGVASGLPGGVGAAQFVYTTLIASRGFSKEAIGTLSLLMLVVDYVLVTLLGPASWWVLRRHLLKPEEIKNK